MNPSRAWRQIFPDAYESQKMCRFAGGFIHAEGRVNHFAAALAKRPFPMGLPFLFLLVELNPKVLNESPSE